MVCMLSRVEWVLLPVYSKVSANMFIHNRIETKHALIIADIC
jgi:hypothetical protein